MTAHLNSGSRDGIGTYMKRLPQMNPWLNFILAVCAVVATVYGVVFQVIDKTERLKHVENQLTMMQATQDEVKWKLDRLFVSQRVKIPRYKKGG